MRRRQDENEEWRKQRFWSRRRDTAERGRPAVGMRAEGEGSGGRTGGQTRARAGGLKAVNTTEGRNIGSTCSFAEAGPQEDAKCSESDFTDFVAARRNHLDNSAQSLEKEKQIKDKRDCFMFPFGRRLKFCFGVTN